MAADSAEHLLSLLPRDRVDLINSTEIENDRKIYWEQFYSKYSAMSEEVSDEDTVSINDIDDKKLVNRRRKHRLVNGAPVSKTARRFLREHAEVIDEMTTVAGPPASDEEEIAEEDTDEVSLEPPTMSYLLENSSPAHLETLNSVLTSWTLQNQQDMVIVSREGHQVITSQALLCLHSSLVRQILASIKNSTTLPVISVRDNSRAVSGLISLLTSGVATSGNKEDLEGVKGAAESLGVTLANCVLQGKKGEQRIINIITGRESIKKQLNKTLTLEEVAVNKDAPVSVSSLGKRNISIEVAPRKKTNPLALPPSTIIESKKEQVRIEVVEVPIDTVAVKSKLTIGVTCGFCAAKFSDNKTLDNHIKRDHKRESAEKLKQQERKPNDGNLFQCQSCFKEFSSTTALRLHENIHLEVLPFQCDPCNKGFSQKGNLKTHMKRYHPELTEGSEEVFDNHIPTIKMNPIQTLLK